MPVFHVERLARCKWLAVLLPYCAIAGGGGGGEGGQEWRPEDYESSYVEAAVTITCLALALAFEKVWHHLYNHMNRSHHTPEAAPEDLFKDLMDRAGGEFMTLGFLAFCIFLFNNCGGFKWCVNAIHDEGISLPITEGAWLHLAEVVHMQLFLAMIIYFAVISRTVRGAVAKLRHWEKLQAVAKGMPPGSEQTTAPTDKDLQEYSQWLHYFNSRMIRRSQQNPAEFADLFAEFDIDASEVDYTEKLQKLLLDHFCLHRYLALNVSAGVRDSIHIHTKTWFLMILLFVLFGLLHRYAHWTMHNLMPAFVVAAILISIVMHAVVRRKQLQLQRRTRLPNDDGAEAKGEYLRTVNSTSTKTGKKRRLHEKYNTEIIVIRILQVMLFLISYILARDLVDLKEWNSDPVRSVCFALILAAILLLLAYWLPRAMPLFLGLMSMPPYVDDDNFRLFSEVLLRCTQECEMKLVRSLTSQHRTLLRDNSHMLVTVLSPNQTKEMRSRSEFGATVSAGGNSMNCDDSTLIITYDDTFLSEDRRSPNSQKSLRSSELVQVKPCVAHV